VFLLRGLFYFLIAATLISSGSSTTILKTPTTLDFVRFRGTLKVLTRIDPTTYYKDTEGFTGLEYDLVTLFAKRLGVKVKFIVPDTFEDLLNQIAAGKADIAAASLTITEQRRKHMRFTMPYHQITEQIIFRSSNRRPKKPTDLKHGILEVVKGTSHVESLKKLQQQTPGLDWLVNDQLDTNGLLYLVNEGLIDYTVADSNQITLIGRFFPKLNVAFDISPSRQIAWALPKSNDASLYNEVQQFFKKITRDHTLEQLLERHYGHANLNYVGLCKFREHVRSRLPEYRSLFKQASAKNNLDWRLLAAIGYQESHWLEKATSPTGVKGIMMLTRGTARQLGIKQRTDPVQSIFGGARYFRQRINKIPLRIPEPDRTWMALAAYNVGFGHLEDARILTQQRGGNPDQWIDVKKSLPLLSKKKWYKRVKHGYARGREPVRYVENIRSYFDLLIWLTEENRIRKNAMSTKTIEPKQPNMALDITPPAL